MISGAKVHHYSETTKFFQDYFSCFFPSSKEEDSSGLQIVRKRNPLMVKLSYICIIIVL
nr:MAG TPA: hypothetical protein [Caudoviricetes sp.]